MSLKTRVELKAFFETSDTPTEPEYIHLIDSLFNLLDDSSGVIEGWIKYTKNYDDFQPQGSSQSTIVIDTKDAGTTLLIWKLKHSVSFTGGPITDTDISVRAGVLGFTSVDVFRAVGSAAGATQVGGNSSTISNHNSNWDFKLLLAVTNGVIDDLTQGSVEVWVKTVKLI